MRKGAMQRVLQQGARRVEVVGVSKDAEHRRG
jgi:hypothetical protein